MPDAEPEPDLAANGADTAKDATLGGYFEVHNRPPAFEGSDGHPYTVSPEIEQTSNLRTPYAGFLVFPRWAQTGVGIVGHVETPVLVERRSSQQSMQWLGKLTLVQVQEHLEAALEREREEST